MFYVGLLIVWLCFMSDIVLFIIDLLYCIVLIYSAVQLQVCLINLLTYLLIMCVVTSNQVESSKTLLMKVDKT